MTAQPPHDADEAVDEAQRAHGRHGAPTPGARLRSLLVRTRLTGVHVLIVLLFVGFGFAVVVQVRQSHEDAYATMRQDDLVRLLDELNKRNDELDEEGATLRRELAELVSGSSSQAAAQEAAEQQARVQGILAGTLAVEGPGIELVVADEAGTISASVFVNVLEELRAAGAEAVELNGHRLTMSSWITGAVDGIVVNGATVTPPYTWRAIGDPHTLAGALGIPGGALSSIRGVGGQAELTQHDRLEITSVRTLRTPEAATPVPVDD